MSHVDDGQLNALLDNELDAAERAAVQAHLESCHACRSRLEEARAFLVESGALLEVLDDRAIGRSDDRAIGRSDDRAIGRSDDRVARTAREKAIDLPIAKTAQEPALNIDGRTAKTVASPFFPQAAERIAAQAARELEAAEALVRAEEKARRWAIAPQLAWAATIVLAIGVGFLANEVMDLREARRPQQMAAAEADRADSSPAEVSLSDAAPAARPAPTAAAPARAQPQPAAGGAGALSRDRPLRTQTRIPDIVRREKPEGEELAGVSGVAEPRATDAAGPALAQAPSAPRAEAPAPPSAFDSRLGAAESRRSAAAAEGRREEAPAANRARPAAFQTISADSAIRAMSGSMRLIDGMRPQRIEIGPGALVSGANAEREVVRVHYTDAAGRALILDQQPGDGAATSVNGLIRGDTLVTPVGEGTRIRWLDRKNFWLSLTGAGSQEELMGIVQRIR